MNYKKEKKVKKNSTIKKIVEFLTVARERFELSTSGL